jgi:hypothetical protein
MIFFLDQSLTSITDKNIQSHFIDFMENLCVARKNGRHIICSEITTLDSLISLASLGDRTRATLAKVARKVRGKLTLFEACTIYVRVFAAPGNFQKITLPNGKEEIQISSDSIDSDEFFIKTRFLVENRTDGVFYGGLAKMALHQESQLKNVILNYEIIAGGGSQTPREYQNLKDTKHLTLCMVDSDVDYLGASLGNNTAAPIFAMDQTAPPVISKSVILNCYSAENLIHPAMLKSTFKLKGTEAWYIDLNGYYNTDFWMFLALKQKKTCLDFIPGNPKALYWSSKRAGFSKVACHPVCDPKLCSVFKPLPPTTLSVIANHLDEGNFSFLPEIVFDGHDVFKEWNIITKNLFSWACSGDRMSST